MDRWQGKVAIVTGASAGIGAAIVVALAEADLKVVALARRKERLEELQNQLEAKGKKIYPVQCDITKEEDVIAAFQWIKSNLGPIHVLINNAGVAKPTSLLEGSTEQFKQILDTNVLGLTIATREAVQDMRDNSVDGHIVHINSVVGHCVPAVPNMNIYPASKHAVTALAETLRHELTQLGSKIKITSLSPGLVDTEIFEANGYLKDENVVQMLSQLPKLQGKDVADALLYVLGTPPHVQVQELTVRPVSEMFS